MSTFYILNDKKEVVPASLEEWATLLKDRDYGRVDYTVLRDIRISTKFFGIPGVLDDPEHPRVFETIIYYDSVCDLEPCILLEKRCSTWDEAVEWHQRYIKIAKRFMTEPHLVTEGFKEYASDESLKSMEEMNKLLFKENGITSEQHEYFKKIIESDFALLALAGNPIDKISEMMLKNRKRYDDLLEEFVKENAENHQQETL